MPISIDDRAEEGHDVDVVQRGQDLLFDLTGIAVSTVNLGSLDHNGAAVLNIQASIDNACAAFSELLFDAVVLHSLVAGLHSKDVPLGNNKRATRLGLRRML